LHIAPFRLRKCNRVNGASAKVHHLHPVLFVSVAVGLEDAGLDINSTRVSGPVIIVLRAAPFIRAAMSPEHFSLQEKHT
jgi:hypothetical protein